MVKQVTERYWLPSVLRSGDHRAALEVHGIAVKLKDLCSNCGELDAKLSSQRVGGTANCNPFEINFLAVHAIQSTGNGQTLLNDILPLSEFRTEAFTRPIGTI